MAKRRTPTAAELARLLADLDRRSAEADRRLRASMDLANQELDQRIDRVNRQVGELTNGWGRFVEELARPGVEPALAALGYNVEETVPRLRRRLGPEMMEIDVRALAHGPGDRDVVVAGEIKSRLDVPAVDFWLDRLDRFFEFFPEYRDRELEGLVCGIDTGEGVAEYAIRQGLFVLASSGDAVYLANPDGFRPRVWRA